jgi:hypothetical protein
VRLVRARHLRSVVAHRCHQGRAARLFAQFMISPPAQKMIAEGGVHSSRIDIAPPPGQPALSEVKFLPVDLDLIEERGRELKGDLPRFFSSCQDIGKVWRILLYLRH